MSETHPNDLYQRYLHPCRHDKKRIRRMEALPAVPVEEKLRSLLRLGGTYSEDLSIEVVALVLEYGREFPIAVPSSQWTAPEPYWQCFNTANSINACHGDFLYAEGIGMPFGQVQGAMLHAWNVDAEDYLLYDFTWPKAPWNQYFGIIFDREWTARHCVMPHGIFHPIHWEKNRGPVTEYLKSRPPRSE